MRRVGRVVSALAAMSLLVASLPVAAGAVITGTSGQLVKIAAPASVFPDQLESTTSIFAFDERQGVTLASPLRVDITQPGTYDQSSDLQPTTVATGTAIDSHYVHNDRAPGGTTVRTGSVTFPTDILGVIVTRGKLADSDILGAPGTAYPGAAPNRELELTGAADVVVLPDLRTVQVTLSTATAVDDLRIVTRHDDPPTANAGGPYAGTEGAPVTLAGSASDPQGETLTTSWSIAWTARPGTVCTATGTNTLTPAITCTDDALVTATLSVSDGVNPAVTSVANVTIGNTAPTLGTVGVPAAPVPLGGPVSATVAFADAGTHDTHSSTITWGDTTSSTGAVSESGGTGSVSASHVYAAPGLYTVTVTVTDDDLGTVSKSAQVAVNGPPAADSGGPYNGSEGLPVGLVGTAVDPENDALATSWAFTPSGLDAGGSCTALSTTTLIPSLTCNDDAVVAADLTASDGINPPVASSTTVTIDNEAPILGALVATAGPVPTGATVSVVAPFTDGGTNDTHSATVSWGDLTSSPAAIAESNGSGALDASHAYGAPGLYTVTVTVTDDDLGTDTSTTTILVNSAPIVDAGGPYVGSEGTPLSLAGNASDVDGDALSTLWSFTWTGGPGTSCSATGTDTLTPTVHCNDDTTVTATLTVSDGVNPAVVSTTTLAVGNVAPTVTAAVASPSQVPEGVIASIGLSFGDVGTNDTHTATVDWGDASTSSGIVSESGGLGSVTASHLYGTPGTYHVTVTVADDNGGSTSSETDIMVNGSPTADAGGPYAGVEGSGVSLNGTATDPENGALGVAWSFGWTADPGTTCSATGTGTLTPLLTCTDDATVTGTLTVNDGVNPAVVAHTTFQIGNRAPTVTPAVPSESLVATGSTVSVGLTFGDVGTNDTHTSTVQWGDSTTSPGLVSESGGSGAVSASHVYATHGTYHVTVTVTDDNGGTDSSSTDITVNGVPTVGAGGPYSGVEGAGVTLSGTAVDPDADTLAITWTHSIITADPGTTCSLTGEHTLTPVLTCTDDATVTVTLTASDGINPDVVDSATVQVLNAVPTVAAPIILPNPVGVGAPVVLSSSFTDPGANDDHTATINWGDSTSSTGTVTETLGSGGTVSGSHAFGVAGTYTVKVTVNDKDGGKASATTTVVVSAPPTADAGGPYAGVEGAATILSGAATDPEGDPLGVMWSFAWTGSPGTSCSATATSTLTPAVTCTDDATVTATLTVSDGVNPAVVDTATLAVGNAAPAVGSLAVPSGAVPIGASVNALATFGDAGTNDTHTATIDWGDTTSSPAAVTESAGSGSAAGSHVFGASGTYTVQVTVTDDDGGSVTVTGTVIVNGAPVVSAGGPYNGVEGTPAALAATAVDPNGDPLGISWTFTWTGGPGTACTATSTGTLSPAVTCNDDATVLATLNVTDSVNPPVVRTATVNIANANPTVGPLTVPVSPVPLGSPINVLTTFGDAGRNDTHTASVSWGDSTTSAGIVNELSGSGSVSASHVYAGPGTYSVSVTITDDNGGSVVATATTYIVVYDRKLSFVTGGGWITSPSGAYTPGDPTDPDITGRGNFGFVSRYSSNTATVPTGNTEFELRVRSAQCGYDDHGGTDHHSNQYGRDDECDDDRWDDSRTTSRVLNFHSTGYLWLVVTNGRTKAYYRGSGTVNGVAGYEFIVSVIDGRNTSAPDRFRIKVWNTATGTVVYDNLPGAPDDASATTAISGGSIVIH